MPDCSALAEPGGSRVVLSDWMFSVVSGGTVESCPKPRVLGEKKKSRLRAPEQLLLMGARSGPVSELRMAFHFHRQEACKWICVCCMTECEWWGGGRWRLMALDDPSQAPLWPL